MDRPLSAKVRLWRTYRGALTAAGIGAGVALGLGFWAFAPRSDLVVHPSSIQTATATLSRVAEVAGFVGSAVPKDLVQVDASEGGRIAEIFVQAGETVSAGQKIMRLDNAERELAINTRISQIRADLNALRAQQAEIEQSRLADKKSVLEAKYALQKADGQLARRQILEDKGLITEAHLAPNRQEVAFYRTMVAEAEATAAGNETLRAEQQQALAEQGKALQSNLAIASAQMTEFVIAAPRDGMIIGLTAKLGATVASGSNLAQIDPRQGLVVEAELDQFYASRVSLGMSATISGLEDRTLVLTKLSPEIRDGAFKVELAFEGTSPLGLKAGETVQGRLMLNPDVDAVTIPNGPFMARANGQYVFVLSDDGSRADRRTIQTGIRTVDQVAVVAGLQPGERVIVSDYADFADARTIDLQ